MMSLLGILQKEAFGVRSADETFARRKRVDRYLLRYLRSCAVCKTSLPPIDFMCPSCWRTFGRLMNRGENLKQPDYVLPTYSLLTWTPLTAPFVKPLIYGFKGGRAAIAAERFATLFVSEKSVTELPTKRASPELAIERSALVSAPAIELDHSGLWTQALARQTKWPACAPLVDKASRTERQKELQAGERGLRRYAIREDFADHVASLKSAKSIVFADDVVTSGSTAMAAFMALGDPDGFEVWSLVARPRLAAKGSAC